MGLISFASDYVLRDGLAMIGNLAGTWVVAAFAVGAAARSRSLRMPALLGQLTLVVATIAYYVTTATQWPASGWPKLIPGIMVWSAVSVIAGPLAAAAGWLWRNHLGERRRWWVVPAAVGLIGGVLVAEGAFWAMRAWSTGTIAFAAAEILLGLLAPLVLLPSARGRILGVGAAVGLAGIALLLLLAFWQRLLMLAGSGRL